MKYMSTRNDETKGKWYARVAPRETVDLDGLAKHMSRHNTPYSVGCIRGVLTDMASCIKELLLEGKNVKIPDLVIFSLGMRSRAADSAKEFTADNIMGYSINARGTGDLRPSDMMRTGEIKVSEYHQYVRPEEKNLSE